MFEKGLRHGEGIYMFKDKSKFCGKWLKDKNEPTGVIIEANGN